MKEQYYILDEALPISQDFKQLKEESLAYLQEFSGNAWTNFNPSDPGITILDQLCFALTELGYCIDFPMRDILTDKNDELIVDGQFYRAEEILTTSPVTVNDFRKYIIDGIDIVQNALIIPRKYGVSSIGGVYDTYLYIQSANLSQDSIDYQIGLAARYQFARCRNFGESFTTPKTLGLQRALVSGSIEVESKQELEKIIQGAQDAINNYIFPAVKQYSFKELQEEGMETNEIFDGPRLLNGWIKNTDLGTKKDTVKLTQLIMMLDGVTGIQSVLTLKFSDESDEKEVSCEVNEILEIDLINSISEGDLTLTWKGKEIDENRIKAAVAKLKLGTTTHNPSKEVVKTIPQLPEGKYREIHEYYSVQNTFPEIFGVGENSIEGGASDYTIGRSRQLKGYLTIFDQVLANEFEQLASLHRLFSFKNAMSPAPHDLLNYLNQMDQFERANQEYPVPYQRFSPTYFCQSLYEVPNIRPLLKDSDAFDYALEMKSEGQQEIDSWKAYQADPYNAYMHGMMEVMEDTDQGWERRNEILDHILARHGESPYLIDEIIADSEYALNKVQNQVIFKSLYLQNFGLLSYYRCKAYNYLGARKINEVISLVSDKTWEELNAEISRDFIFQSHFIDRVEGLSESDFDSYSGLELKLNILLGLRAQYRNFIVDNHPDKSMKDEVCQANWMMTERKGVILIESNLLLESADFEMYIREEVDHQKSWKIGGTLNYEDVQRIRTWMVEDEDRLLEELNKKEQKTMDGFPLTREELKEKDDWFKQVGSKGLQLAVKVSWDGESEMSAENIILQDLLHLFVPDYLSFFSESVFTNTLDHFMADSIAPHIGYRLYMLNTEQLERLIAVFSQWYNSLIFNAQTSLKVPEVIATAKKVVRQLVILNSAEK